MRYYTYVTIGIQLKSTRRWQDVRRVTFFFFLVDKKDSEEKSIYLPINTLDGVSYIIWIKSVKLIFLLLNSFKV